MKIFSFNIVCGSISKQNVYKYARIWKYFLQTIHKQPEIVCVDDKYTYV